MVEEKEKERGGKPEKSGGSGVCGGSVETTRAAGFMREKCPVGSM